MLVGEALVGIDMVDFWEFVSKHHPNLGEVLYGVPRVNKHNNTLEIDVAFSQECHPKDWTEKSKAELQWKEIK